MKKITDLKSLIEYHQEVIDICELQRNAAVKDLNMNGLDLSDKAHLLKKAQRAAETVARHKTAIEIISELTEEIEGLKNRSLEVV